MKPENIKQYQALVEHIRSIGPSTVAFSGGTDSTLLLFAAREALEGNLLAISVRTPYVTGRESDEAEALARLWDIPHIVVETPVPENIKDNPPDRCYLCKKHLFTLIMREAAANGYHIILEGTNADDIHDNRPGLKALREMKVRSPLLDTGLGKEAIRAISRMKKLPAWDKPANACLLTRLPFGAGIELPVLRRIEKAEEALQTLGFRAARVRVHGELARIEVPHADIGKIASAAMRTAISEALLEAGFIFVTLDLMGYRTGSFNEEPLTKKHEN